MSAEWLMGLLVPLSDIKVITFKVSRDSKGRDLSGSEYQKSISVWQLTQYSPDQGGNDALGDNFTIFFKYQKFDTLMVIVLSVLIDKKSALFNSLRLSGAYVRQLIDHNWFR